MMYLLGGYSFLLMVVTAGMCFILPEYPPPVHWTPTLRRVMFAVYSPVVVFIAGAMIRLAAQ